MKRFQLGNLLGGERINLPLANTLGQEHLHPMCLVTPCRRIEDVRTVICGHSNAAPVYRSVIAEAKGAKTRAMEIGAALGLAGLAAKEIGADYTAMIKRLGRTRNIALVWNGNQANGDFLLAPGQPFDFVPRGYDDVSVLPGARIVPEAMVRAHLAPTVAPIAEILAALGQSSGLERLVLGTQPPLAGNDLIRQRLHHEQHYARRAKDFGVDIETVAITAPSVRRKLWFTLMAMYREAAEAHGARFVPAPDAVVDPDGFLRVEYSVGDVTHANLRYGGLMIEQLAPILAKQGAAA